MAEGNWIKRIEGAIPSPEPSPTGELANQFPENVSQALTWLNSVARPAMSDARALIADRGWEADLYEVRKSGARSGFNGFSIWLEVRNPAGGQHSNFRLSYDMSSAVGTLIQLDPSPSGESKENRTPAELTRDVILDRLAERVEELAGPKD